MFEKMFLPFLFNNYKDKIEQLDILQDPIDTCLNEFFFKVQQVSTQIRIKLKTKTL